MSDYKQATNLLAFIQRHPGHASQKPHGNRFGASGTPLPKGHKRGDVVTGGSRAAQGRASGKQAERSYGFPKDDKGLKQHYNLNEKCKKQPAACEGISGYSADDASVINGHLRGNLKGNDSIAHQNKVREAQETVEKLDKAFEVMPRTPEDMKVARFVRGDVAGMMNAGTVFQDKGFISTTIDPGLSFESFEGEADWKIHIDVPKGSRAIYIAEKSQYPWEQELLFPRNSQVRVTGKDPKTKTITAEYVQ